MTPGNLAARLRALEAAIRTAPRPLAWVDLSPDAQGVFRTINASSDLWQMPPHGVAHLGAPEGMTFEDLREWVALEAPAVSVLVRRRGIHPTVELLGPDSPPGTWEPEAVLEYDLELVKLMGGENHA